MVGNFTKYLIGNSKYLTLPSYYKNISRNMAKTGGTGTKLLDVDTPIIPLSETRRFITECMQKVGTPKPHAEALSSLLAEADYRGHYSHGMNRLEIYINDVTSGMCNPAAEPTIISQRAGTALVDGNNGIGAYIGNFCMDLAMTKAKEVGIGFVTARGSNHYGIAGMYALQAIKKGMIGMSFTNTSPLMSPTRSKGAALGTNPIALGAPAENGDSFVLDMATTAVALGKVEMEKRKGNPIREGWAQGPDGYSTTDATLAYEQGCLMPLGGEELTSGYKGFGLGLLVEVLCGILSGSNYGPDIRKWADNSKIANLGQCFIAIDVSSFEPGFESRMSDLMNKIRNMEPANPELPVLVAGDPERLHMAAVDRAGGVKYVQHQLDSCQKLAEKYNIKPLQSV